MLRASSSARGIFRIERSSRFVVRVYTFFWMSAGGELTS